MPADDRERRPVHPTTGEPLSPDDHPGYYPGLSTLAQQGAWDDATREVVLRRVTQVPPLRFFSAHEIPLARAVVDRLLPQDDRVTALPVLELIDEKLYAGKLEGYRYEDTPDHRWAIRLGLRGIDAMARAQHRVGFVELGARAQEDILQAVSEGKPVGAEAIWKELPPQRLWSLLMNDVVAAYYAHPLAWDEIGFGGPAYPRGYMRLENGEPEPWEVREKRSPGRDWAPPPGSPSAVAHPPPGGGGSGGHGGTH